MSAKAGNQILCQVDILIGLTVIHSLMNINIACWCAERCGLEPLGWLNGVQVETAAVQPLKAALTEGEWMQHKARLAAESESHKQAQEAAAQERQLAQAEAAQQRAAEEVEVLRQSTLTQVHSSAFLLGCMPMVYT